MLQHILYVLAPNLLEETRLAMVRLKATQLKKLPRGAEGFHIQHDLLGAITLNVTFIHDIDLVTNYLMENPVDLLIYDERGEDSFEAVEAAQIIKTNVNKMAEELGPGFLFPMRRMINILQDHSHAERRSFELGRIGIRDVIIDPKSTAHILRWIRRVLYAGILRENRVGVALSGGGLEGFLYQLGVIHALNSALSYRSLSDIDVVSGISSGALAGSLLAGNIDTTEIIRAVHNKSDHLPPLTSGTLFDLAVSSISKRVISQSLSWNLKPSRWMANLQRSLPTGFFKGDALEAYFEAIMDWANKTNRFQDLNTEFYVGATDQDSYKHVIFGETGLNKMNITEALRASSAFPLVFAPKEIQGRRYIDGQVTRSCNLEITIRKGCSLVFIIDPLKPAKNHRFGTAEAEGGFFTAIQVIKALCSTRFEANLKHVTNRFPDADFIIFQPDEECASLMEGSPMRYKIRTQLIEMAYRSTLRKLRAHHPIYAATLNRYGFELKETEHLRDLEEEYDRIFETSNKSNTY